VSKSERGKERRQRASHPKQHRRSQEWLQTSPDGKEAFIQTKGKATRRRGFNLVNFTSAWMTLDERSIHKLLCVETRTNKNQVLARWKEHFEEHLNEGSTSEQPTRPVDLRIDGVDIDLPSREEIEGALKHLKNNKGVSADCIAVELLNNDGPNLVDALHEVIQQA
jgi:hypothetical protein